MGTRFDEEIKMRGISLYRISKDTGIPYTTLHNFVSGKRNLKAETRITLAKYLEIPLAELVPELNG